MRVTASFNSLKKKINIIAKKTATTIAEIQFMKKRETITENVQNIEKK